MDGPPSIGAALRAAPIEHATRSIGAGDHLFHRGSPVEELYLVRSGSCRLERTTYDGRTLVLGEFGPDQVVAEGSLFHRRYGCDCRVTAPTTVAVFPAPEVIGLLGEQPALAREWLGSLARQVMDLRTRLELRNIKSARDRVMLFLTLNADQTGHFRYPGTLKTIAETLGLTPEALYRTLADLERQGAIRRHPHMIEIMKPGG